MTKKLEFEFAASKYNQFVIFKCEMYTDNK
jgi:hypothetical protein